MSLQRDESATKLKINNFESANKSEINSPRLVRGRRSIINGLFQIAVARLPTLRPLLAERRRKFTRVSCSEFFQHKNGDKSEFGFPEFPSAQMKSQLTKVLRFRSKNEKKDALFLP